MSGTDTARILVIDDDEMTLTIVHKMLDAAKVFTTDTVLSARDALARLSQSSYDAILCDMWMPGMTGKEFYQKLESDIPEYLDRIVFITGDIASEATWDFIEERNLPYVLKPINHQDLIRKLQQVIKTESSAAAKDGGEKRRGRRVAIKASAWVRKRWAAEDPEIAPVANASREGVFFLTNREYRVGAEVLVSFPYTGTSDIEQKGYVVRVEERDDGRRGVAIALGAAAEAVGSVLSSLDRERSRDRVQGLTEWEPATPRPGPGADEGIRVADLKLQLAQARQEAGFLVLELADLKAVYERLTGQLDAAAASEAGQDWELREIIAAKTAITQVVEDLKQQILTLRQQVADAQARQEKKEEA